MDVKGGKECSTSEENSNSPGKLGSEGCVTKTKLGSSLKEPS